MVWQSFKSLIQRDIMLYWGSGQVVILLAFFLIAVSLFPFGIGPEPQILARIAVGTVWVVGLLATLISLDRMYQWDREDGSLDQMALSPIGLMGTVMAKIIAHWLAVMIPLTLMAPMLALMLGMPVEGLRVLWASLILGTPALSLIGSMGAALTLLVRRGGGLVALLVLPFFVPTLIFAVSAVEAALTFSDPLPHLALTAAVSFLALICAPLASILAIKIAAE